MTSDAQPFVAGGLLTVSEVAAAMRVSTMTVYRLIKTGEMGAVRVGRSYRIRGSDLERFLQERSVHVEEAT
jgi:excisionase family DNA binding protein